MGLHLDGCFRRVLLAEPMPRTCDLHDIAVIQLSAMKAYGLQSLMPRLDCRNRPVADVP